MISDSQFGFRKNYSTELALAYSTDLITSELDKGNCVIGLFLDLKKAFDTVHHDILLKKTKPLWCPWRSFESPQRLPQQSNSGSKIQ